MNVFSERLRELRGAESQASFAASIGVNRVQYAKYESGVNAPSVDLLRRICEEHAGVSADWLLGLPKSAAQSAAKTAAPTFAEATAGRQTAAVPGEMPACSKCPYKKRWEKIAAMK